MVFFACNACGESLKKAQVDKHRPACRAAQGLSCIDCGQDFWGDAYKTHTKCISEDQKYGGKEFEPRSNKGDLKQQQWIQRIHEAMNKPGIGAKLKDVLKQVSSYDNVPRKKAKFQNWMKNSLKIHNLALHDQVWEIFSAATDNTRNTQQDAKVSGPAENGTEKMKMQQNSGTGAAPEEKSKRERKEERRKKKQLKELGTGKVEEQDDPAEKRKKKRKRGVEESKEEGAENKSENNVEEEPNTRKQKKRKRDTEDVSEENAENDEEEQSPKGKFNWKGTIKAILRQYPEEGIPMKKLRRKVLAAYYAFSGEGNFRSEEELLSLFNKKVNSNSKFRVLKEKVRLVK
ncbi:cell growth-regulating nucleolar protein [Scleropages formosus]|nr:cell growth-regulating nucleolar protein [Scleropages formosus]